jgi:hypothetical protein
VNKAGPEAVAATEDGMARGGYVPPKVFHARPPVLVFDPRAEDGSGAVFGADGGVGAVSEETTASRSLYYRRPTHLPRREARTC